VIYGLRHRTTYSYGNSVSFARCVLRLTPRSSVSQTVLESSIKVSPRPSLRQERTGPFGAEMVTVMVDKPHDTLVIDARSRIDVHTPAPPEASASLPWEHVRARAFENREIGSDGPAAYLYPTHRTPLVSRITDYTRESLAPGRPIIAAVSELMSRVYKDFRYDPGATEVSTPVWQAFDARHGVCQDFAQIMITGLRGLGVPTAYVSGYLRTIPPEGRPRLEGADATHAWISVWCGEDTGWIGFDPTNDILAADDHIVLATGRDYADVAPIDGVILATGAQTLKVEVDVVPEIGS
jgi:transglutaminase-like putative cysteine protease